MPNWYSSREAVKRAGTIWGPDQNARIDRLIEAASVAIERRLHRIFIPKTQTRLYRWPRKNSPADLLWLDFDLLSVTTLQSKAQDSSPTTIVAADYFLEPNNYGPPYDRIEIDLSSSAFFSSGDTPQRSISVLGSWGYSNATASVGTVSSGLAADVAATSMVCSDASVIDVGDMLLVQSEQVFVKERAFAALGTILVNDASITAAESDDSITVDAAHGIVAGEIIKLDSEEMYVKTVVGNVLTVIRSYDGTTLATHADDTAVHINRTITIVRAQNGTTAATHANATAISKYTPPKDIAELCLAIALASFNQENAAYSGTIGSGEGQREYRGTAIQGMWKDAIRSYRRLRVEAI